MNARNLVILQDLIYIPLQKSGKGRGYWTDRSRTITVYAVVSVVTFVPALELIRLLFQTVNMNIGCGIPLIGIVLISLLDSLH
jgi:hypothetical protein